MTYVSALLHRVTFRARHASVPNTSSTFVRMSALCVYVSLFLYRFEVHVFSAFENILSQDFSQEETCNPKFIYFPKEPDYLMLVRRWGEKNLKKKKDS